MADILLTDTNELRIENGDLVLGDGRLQRVRIRLFAAKGQLRHAPLVGENIRLKQGGRQDEVYGLIEKACRAEGVLPSAIGGI